MPERRIPPLAFLWARHRWAVIGLGLALLAVVAFTVRLVVFAVYWSDPAHRDHHPVEGWMTPAYVAHSRGLDRTALRDALGLDPGTRATLEEIAASRGVPVDAVIAEVEAAVSEARAP
jgi:hypothetical protein